MNEAGLSALLYKKEDVEIFSKGLALLSQGLIEAEKNKLFFTFFTQITDVLTALYAIAECTWLTYVEICQILRGVTSNSLLKAAKDFRDSLSIFSGIKKYLRVDNQTIVAILSDSGDKVAFNLEAFFDKRYFFYFIPIFPENIKLAVSNSNCFVDRLKSLYFFNLFDCLYSFGISLENTEVLISSSFPVFEVYYEKKKNIEEIFNEISKNKVNIIEIGNMLRRIPNAKEVHIKFYDILFGEISDFSSLILNFHNNLPGGAQIIPVPLHDRQLPESEQSNSDYLSSGAQLIPVSNFFQLNSDESCVGRNITKHSSFRVDDRPLQ
jgi:hypothetical protein